MSRRRGSILTAALMLALTGSLLPVSITAQDELDPAVEGIDWVVTEAPGASLRLDAGVAIIEDACGRAEIGYVLEPGIAGLRFESLEPGSLCESTRDGLAALSDVDGYDTGDDRLWLVDAATVRRLELIPITPAALPPAGSWQVLGYDAGGEGELIDPLPDSDLGVTFASGSALDARSGCGGFVGTHDFEADSVFIGIRGFGVGECSDRARADEIGFSDALQAAATWRREDERLELIDGDGRVRVLLAAVTDSVVGAWIAQGIARADGRIIEPDGAASVTLDLAADGTFTGSSGCRPLEGSALIEDDRIAFVEVSRLGPRCDGDERRLERRLVRALDRVIAWRRDGRRLTLTDAIGTPLVELIAAEDA